MKIAFLCDMHLPDSKKSPQYEFFCRALKQMEDDGIKTVVNLGDINAFGEVAPFEDYIERMKGFEKIELLPNEEKTVNFVINEDMLKFIKRDLTYGAEDGTFQVFIGKDSRCESFDEFKLIKNSL